MQEINRRDELKLTDAKDLTSKNLQDALDNPDNKVVALHKPGSIITHSDGRKYEVDKNGSWKRIRDEYDS